MDGTTESFWRLAVENSPLGVCMLDAQGRAVYLSPRYTAITGYTIEDVPTAAVYVEKAYPDPEERAPIWENFHEFLENGPKGQMRYRETRIWCGDGVYRQIVFRSLKGPDGSVVLLAEDVTQRRQTEDRYRTLADQSPLGIALGSAEGRFLYLNPAFKRIFGFSLEEMPDDETWFERAYPDPDLREKSRADWKNVLSQTKPGTVAEREYPIETAEGETKQIGFQTVGLQDGSVMVICEDKTLIRQAQKERKALEVQLYQAQKMEAIGTLAAGIAHEINSPMQYLAANLQFLEGAFSRLAGLTRTYSGLKDRPADPDLAERLGAAESGAELPFLLEEIPKALKSSLGGLERITEVVSAMRQLSHPSGSDADEFDLNRVVGQALKICASQRGRGLELEVEMAEGLPPVRGSRNQFSQAVINLVVNAFQALEKGHEGQSGPGRGLVKVTTRRTEDWLEVEVADNGPGIDPMIGERIFEPFFTTKQVGQGTGLGLYLVHKTVVEQMNGHIDVKTSPENGAAFTLCLPLRD